MNNDYAIDVKDLTKSFNGKIAVDKASIRVKRGEIFGFLGPNGSGKTTTIRMLCGLLIPDSGSGHCLGYDILTQSLAIKQHIGYMPQRFSLYEELSVYENLNFIADLYKVSNKQQQIEECIKLLGLERYRNQLAAALSGGWKQRLALAAGLVHSPQLLLLDEPTAGVDPKARREFWEQLHTLSLQGISTLVSTHYMDEASRCHNLAYVLNSKILVVGTQNDIIAKSGLFTWEVTEGDLNRLALELRTNPAIYQVTSFGNSLHVNGKNEKELQQAINPFMNGPFKWRRIKASLEDAFIALESGQTNGK